MVGVLTSDQKGSIDEIEIACAAIRLGIGVYKPLNDGDRYAFLATLTPDATLTDDGNPRSLRDWIDREIFSAHGHMNVERE